MATEWKKLQKKLNDFALGLMQSIQQIMLPRMLTLQIFL